MSSQSLPRRRALWAVTAVLLSGATASAAPITYEYGGVITSADPSTGVAAGTPFSGTFTYDPTATPSGELSDAAEAMQYFFGKTLNSNHPASDGSGITLQVGAQTVLANPGGIQIGLDQNNYGQGPRTNVSVSNSSVDGNPLNVLLDLNNPTRQVFGSLAPPLLLSLADFTQAQLNVTEQGKPGLTLYAGTITSLTVVPEPGSTTLICLAAAAWVAWSRGKRAR